MRPSTGAELHRRWQHPPGGLRTTAALNKQKNSVQFLDRRSRHFRKQARIVRKFIERWDERNWVSMDGGGVTHAESPR